jgi:hypothetical protein
VGAEDDDVVGIAFLCLGDDVPRLARLEDGVDEEGGLQLLAGCKTGFPGRADLEGDDAGGDELSDIRSTKGGRAVGRAGRLVVEDDAEGTVGLGELELV